MKEAKAPAAQEFRGLEEEDFRKLRQLFVVSVSGGDMPSWLEKTYVECFTLRQLTDEARRLSRRWLGRKTAV